MCVDGSIKTWELLMNPEENTLNVKLDQEICAPDTMYPLLQTWYSNEVKNYSNPKHDCC
jgi:hypothetical protein